MQFLFRIKTLYHYFVARCFLSLTLGLKESLFLSQREEKFSLFKIHGGWKFSWQLFSVRKMD